MPFATLPDGVRLYYETKGAGEPLLLVMGRASDHLGWGPVPAYAEEMHGRASAAHDSWDRLPAITAPTLVIHGGRDEVAPTANAHLLAERIPGAELHPLTA